ncbi:MAG: hypothetical protein ISN28_08180 [Ectothiorhodospiraceae bacterium AqS1]|nr:hypothetical protein [Ectothiorhodospiraceae bacterium AqS1]
MDKAAGRAMSLSVARKAHRLFASTFAAKRRFASILSVISSQEGSLSVVVEVDR